jgi:hypothetical protein
MSPAALLRRSSGSLLAAAIVLCTVIPASLAAQESSGLIHYSRFGGATLTAADVAPLQVGVFGGGLASIEARRPDLAPLASQFRVQRRSGLALGAAAAVAGTIVFARYTDMSRPAFELTDPEGLMMMGAMGAFTLSAVQLRAADRTLHRLAEGLARQ